MKKISFYTLGCKLNQSETAVLADQFKQDGYEIVPFGESVDVCVINTCTVTAKTDYRCRQMIRRAKKVSPAAKIAVVGCYAQLNSEKIRSIKGVDYILGSDSKFDLPLILNDESQSEQPIIARSDNKQFKNPETGDFMDHTRAFIKIQDGCDNFCSYCAVPLARGRSRSDSMDHIYQIAQQMVARGHKELVLTGVHIGMYGKDLTPPKNLIDVLKLLTSLPGLKRIRLSSLEPQEVDDELLLWISESEKVCHHFHVPLQNGDNEILRLMKRDYTTEEFERIIHRIKEIMPHCGLGTDVIVGFPGETEQHFHNTVEFIDKLPFTYLHVFSYSQRPGTKAARYPHQVNPKMIKQRSEILRDIGKSKKRAFYQSLVGTTQRVLWEGKADKRWMYGWTDNYVRVRIQANTNFINEVSPVKIVGADTDFVEGEVISD